MSKKHKVIQAKVTSRTCPTSVELRLEDGRMAYMRYRYGMLAVRVSQYDTDDIMDAVKGNPVINGVAYPRDRDKFDGAMRMDELTVRTSDAFNWHAVIGDLLREETEHEKLLKEENIDAT